MSIRNPFSLSRLFDRKPHAAAAPARPDAKRSAGPVTDAEWERLREPAREQDRVLSSIARRWLEALPGRVRPIALSEQYPRVANRLALCWNDPLLADRLFDELMINKRARRRGFPPGVAAELLRLREFGAQVRNTEEAVDPWRAQATVDR